MFIEQSWKRPNNIGKAGMSYLSLFMLTTFKNINLISFDIIIFIIIIIISYDKDMLNILYYIFFF